MDYTVKNLVMDRTDKNVTVGIPSRRDRTAGTGLPARAPGKPLRGSHARHGSCRPALPCTAAPHGGDEGNAQVLPRHREQPGLCCMPHDLDR
ncbi:hypothetical protein FB563_7057 [Streptomyces puniciscabiei]|uniref:Uncharacterized protein n=1 Tax=Streptomyces puniciscabiei TaxID=164348 RepID=A0A542TJ92_9ACTN|nr:hypothetical protein FB563_7057 [Streptomyces puniciscabiei]